MRLAGLVVLLAACGARSRHYADGGTDETDADADTDADTDVDSDVDTGSEPCDVDAGTDAGFDAGRKCLSHPENTPPFDPLLLYPTGAECVCTTRPTLLVANSGDTDGDPLRYHFQVDTDPTFRSIDLQETRPDGVPPSAAGVTQWVPPRPLREGPTYFWRAWADDCFEESERVVSVFEVCL